MIWVLRVLERPEIPLNTNASENDIRAFVTKRKISGGTVSRDDLRLLAYLGETPEEMALARKLGYYGYLNYHLNPSRIDDTAALRPAVVKRTPW